MRRVIDIEVVPVEIERDPRTDPQRGDVLERIMRPLKVPVRREVLARRTDADDRQLVRFRRGERGRAEEVRLDEWCRWSHSARVVRFGRST